MTTRETMQVLAKMYRGRERSKHAAAQDAVAPPKRRPVRGRKDKAYVVKGLRP